MIGLRTLQMHYASCTHRSPKSHVCLLITGLYKSNVCAIKVLFLENLDRRQPFKPSLLTSWLHLVLLCTALTVREERNWPVSVWPSCYSIQHCETPIWIYCVWVIGSGQVPARSFLHMRVPRGHTCPELNLMLYTCTRTHTPSLLSRLINDFVKVS